MRKSIILSILTIPFCVLTTTAHAEKMVGYDFNQYATKIYTGKKAPLKLGD